MSALLSGPDFPSTYRRLLEAQCEIEVGGLISAKDPQAVAVALGRTQLCLYLLTLPDRVATLNQEAYDRVKRDRESRAAEPRDSAYALGSPYFWDARGNPIDTEPAGATAPDDGGA